MSGSRPGSSRIKPPPGHLLVGLLHKPHGLGGEITAQLLSDVSERFDPRAVVYVSFLSGKPEGEPQSSGHRGNGVGGENAGGSGPVPVEITSSRQHLGRWLLRFEGCDSREDADRFRGAILSIPESEAIIAEGQFLLGDLVGLEVVSADGEMLGVVEDVLDYPAQDILEIRTEQGNRMIPFVRELIPEVDLHEGVMTLDPGIDLESFLGFRVDRSEGSAP